MTFPTKVRQGQTMQGENCPGLKMAAILAGSWRASPPPLALAADSLSEVMPLLQETGAGSLAYWRWCRSGLAQSPAARRLRQTYRLHSIEAAVFHKQLRDLVQRFRSAGVEPLIVKGWSISRLYPEPGLRPYGDLDVCVRPGDFAAAAARLTRAAGACGVVDLHTGVADLEDRRLDELYERSRLVPLGDVAIRILGAEDQLRHQCLHLMRHGAWRSLWLCDVGAALESLPPDFDWDYCYSGNRRLTEWMQCAVALASRILDARACSPVDVPRWMLHAIPRVWARGAKGNDAVEKPLSACLRDWRGLPACIQRRWPNPIRAAFKMRLSPFNRLPRPVTQIAAFSLRGCQYILHKLGSREQAAAGPFAVHPARVR